MPLVLLQHFRGNLDSWDPGADRRAGRRPGGSSTFDNAGVGGSTGTTPHTIEQMAHDAIAFIAAMEFGQVDLLGFSIGSFVAQEIALIRPDLVRGWSWRRRRPRARTACTAGRPTSSARSASRETSPEEYLGVFFASSAASRKAGRRRSGACTPGPRTGTRPTTWAIREAQYDAVCAWGIPDHALLQRLAAIEQPVFVANGDSDPMILPRYSYLIAGLIPQADGEDLPRLGARVPVPAPRRVRRRRRGFPQRPPFDRPGATPPALRRLAAPARPAFLWLIRASWLIWGIHVPSPNTGRRGG